MSLEGPLRAHQERLLHACGQAAALLLGVHEPARTLVAAMGLMADAVGADRATLVRLKRAAGTPSLTPVGPGDAPPRLAPATLYFSTIHEWARTPRLALGRLYQDMPVVGEGHDISRWLRLLDAGRTLSVVGLDTLPPAERALVEALPVRTLLRAPIHRQGTLWGAVGFDRADNERPWLAPEERLLRALGDMLTALVLRGAFDANPDHVPAPSPDPGSTVTPSALPPSAPGSAP